MTKIKKQKPTKELITALFERTDYQIKHRFWKSVKFNFEQLKPLLKQLLDPSDYEHGVYCFEESLDILIDYKFGDKKSDGSFSAALKDLKLYSKWFKIQIKDKI